MSRVEQIEDQIRALNQDEFKSFRNWFAQFDAEVWDRQIEDDAKGETLPNMAERALEDHASGRSTVL